MQNSKGKEQSFLQGTLILIVATVLAKVIGAVYRIPLTNLLDTKGMGFYSTAYDLYIPMFSIAMAGLPVAISRLIAESCAKNRYKDVSKTLHAAQVIFLVTGTTGFLLMITLAFLLTGNFSVNLFGLSLNLNVFNKGSLLGILAIAPSLLFCCIMSAYKGYFEGLGNMTPTGVCEIIEALGKLIFGYTIASLILSSTHNYSYAAAGALLGISIGEAIGTFYLYFLYRIRKNKAFIGEQYLNSPEALPFKSYVRSIIIVAIPIVLGSLVNNVTSLIDVVMVQKQLANAISKSPEYFLNHFKDLISYESLRDKSFDALKDLPNSLYGCHRGFAYSIYNLIPILTSTLGVSAIPVLAKAWTKNNKSEIEENIHTMIRTVSIIAMPCGAGIFALSEGILSLLYSNKAAIAIATPNLRVLGICAIFAGVNAPLVNMLQAIGKEKIPLKNIAVGALLKIIVNYILVGNPTINIFGVPIGTTVCYAYICIANYISIFKYSKVKSDIVSTILKPFISGAVCGLSAYLVYTLTKSTLGVKISSLASIIIAVIVYIIMVALLNVIKKEDVITLPMGEKLLKILMKFRIVRD